jgi:hypothetical protein
MKSRSDPRERETINMTLATSSSIHQAQRYCEDRQAEIRHDAERTRIGVPKAFAPPDVLPVGVDDLTPAKAQPSGDHKDQRPRSLIDGILSRFLPIRPVGA